MQHCLRSRYLNPTPTPTLDTNPNPHAPPNLSPESKPKPNPNQVCVLEEALGFEIYILLGGLALTGSLLCFAAYSKVKVRLAGADILEP